MKKSAGVNKLDILIIEDWESQLFLLKGFLILEGYRVGEAENGMKAIQRVMEEHFDVVLLDYKMPGMNGMDVLKKIKAIKPEIDIVMISAYGTIERAVEAMEAGAFYYIIKPVDLDNLLTLLNSISQLRFKRKKGDVKCNLTEGKGESQLSLSNKLLELLLIISENHYKGVYPLLPEA